MVIAIIAILASLLLPGLSQARKKAQAVVCTGQLRQLGVAVGGYMADSDGRYPPFRVGGGGGYVGPGYAAYDTQISYVDLLLGEMGLEMTPAQLDRGDWTTAQLADARGLHALWKCPLDDVDASQTANSGRAVGKIPLTYAMTGFVFGDGTDPRNDQYFTGKDDNDQFRAVPAGLVRQPAKSIYLAEWYYGAFATGSCAWDSSGPFNRLTPETHYATNYSRHPDRKRNYLLADFHVEALTDPETTGRWRLDQ